MDTMTCRCPCGESGLEISGQPLMRILCHCTVCQSVYRKPFADVTVLKLSQAASADSLTLDFARHRAPPSVNRGVCPSCRCPVVALMPVFGRIGLAFVPAANFPSAQQLPEAAMHLFYHRRTADADDALPKFSGYWTSEWAFAKHLIPRLFA